MGRRRQRRRGERNTRKREARKREELRQVLVCRRLATANPMGERTPVGRFCWWSLMTTDGERANRFNRDVFGWTFSSMEFPDKSTSRIDHSGKGGLAHPVPLQENFPGACPWITCITLKG